MTIYDPCGWVAESGMGVGLREGGGKGGGACVHRPGAAGEEASCFLECMARFPHETLQAAQGGAVEGGLAPGGGRGAKGGLPASVYVALDGRPACQIMVGGAGGGVVLHVCGKEWGRWSLVRATRSLCNEVCVCVEGE